jgi:hypothetical protein
MEIIILEHIFLIRMYYNLRCLILYVIVYTEYIQIQHIMRVDQMPIVWYIEVYCSIWNKRVVHALIPALHLFKPCAYFILCRTVMYFYIL